NKRLVSGSIDTSILVWDLTRLVKDKPRATESLSPKELEALWIDLSSGNAAQAYQAMAKLTMAPKDTLAFLKEHLHAMTAPDLKVIPDLLADLDADDFAVREKAAEELEKLGEAAGPALQKALKGHLSDEVRRRVEHLLEKLDKSPERLQTVRA